MHFFDAPARRFAVTLISPNSFNSQARRNTSVNVGAFCKFRNDIHAHVYPIRSLKCCMLRYTLHPFYSRIKRTPVDLERYDRSFSFLQKIPSYEIDDRDYAVIWRHPLSCNIAQWRKSYLCDIQLICIYVCHVIGLSLPLKHDVRANTHTYITNITLYYVEPRNRMKQIVRHDLPLRSMYRNKLSYFKIRLSRVIPYSRSGPVYRQ